jgi:hypothetical protein
VRFRRLRAPPSGRCAVVFADGERWGRRSLPRCSSSRVEPPRVGTQAPRPIGRVPLGPPQRCPTPKPPATIHLDPIAYVFFDAASGTEPHQVGVQAAAHLPDPDHSGAVISGRGYGFDVDRIFGLAESPSLTPRHHIEEANGVTEGLHRVAHSGVAGEQGPGLGLNLLIGGREPDTALVDAQRHRT